MTLIPAQSVEYAGEQRFVYRLEADGRVKRVPVELGDTHGEVWVLKGLNVGDRIAVEGWSICATAPWYGIWAR